MRNKIVIGTAKFGMGYGIGDIAYRTVEEEVKRLVEYCAKQGLNTFDTAPDYGESEQLLGKICPNGPKVVTKMEKLEKDEICNDCIMALDVGFQRSLRRLGTASVYGLLVHNVADLYKPGVEKVIDWMQGLKDRGLVKKMGVSIYSQQEIEDFYGRYDFDLIQLPINLFDQRLIVSGTLDWLSAKGVEIHARSLFMKGLLLKQAFPSVADEVLRAHHHEFFSYLTDSSLDPFDVCMGFARKQQKVDRWVLGFSNVEQLRQVVEWEGARVDDEICYENWALASPGSLDPRLWG